ncbi:hypothetical protein G7046_g9745 [Stylonectria norvegica]|nr:hypothetical protein G7046_g9745 [Stylonectria norvegica]
MAPKRKLPPQPSQGLVRRVRPRREDWDLEPEESDGSSSGDDVPEEETIRPAKKGQNKKVQDKKSPGKKGRSKKDEPASESESESDADSDSETKTLNPPAAP